MIETLKNYFTQIYRDRYVLWSLVNRDLQQKYRRSKLGVLWSVITPTGLALIIGFVYATLFSTDPRVFIPLLFASINPWNFMSGSAAGATGAFMAAEGYIKQSSVCAQIFPLRTVVVGFVDLLYSVMAFLVIYLIIQPDCFGPIMLMAAIGLIIMFIFSLALANFAAIINLNIRDYQPFQGLVLQALFYVTPVLYATDMMDARNMQFIYRLNPFYYILELVKLPLQGRELPGVDVYIVAIAITAVLFFASVAVMMREKGSISLKL